LNYEPATVGDGAVTAESVLGEIAMIASELGADALALEASHERERLTEARALDSSGVLPMVEPG